MHLCEGKFIVFQVDAENLLGIVNRGSAKLHIIVVARELFWLCVERDITLSVEWVPRELNSLADELSKFLIPSDYMLSRRVFRRLKERWGSHSVDLFASDANFQCARFIRCTGAWLSGLRHFHVRLGRRRGLLGQLPIPFIGQSLVQAP